MTNIQELRNLLYNYEQGNGPAKGILLDRLFLDNHELEGLLDVAEAAQAVVERWDTPLWKDAPATAVFIEELRKRLLDIEGQRSLPVQG